MNSSQPIKGGLTVHAFQQVDQPLRGTERVLLVDDEAVLLGITAQALQQLGYHPVAFSSAREAIKVFTNDPNAFDIAVVDQTMFEMKGDHLISEIRQIRSDIPTVLWTGYSPFEDAVDDKHSGIDAYLMKPATMGEMSKVLRDLLDAS